MARFKLHFLSKAIDVAHDFLYEGAPELEEGWIPISLPDR